MTRTLTRTPVRRNAPSPVPLRIGARRSGATLYASTHLPTMRSVARRATAALIAAALMLVTLWWIAAAPTLSDRCADVFIGTDSVPADIMAMCESQR